MQTQARPRVNNNQSDCVLRPRGEEILKKYIRGTTIYKQFKKKNFRGYIYDYDKYKRYYKVRYKDNDSAEYSQEEISKMLHKLNKTNKRIAMTATRFDCIQVEYAKTQTSYNEPLYFTGGHAKGIAQIEINNYDQCGLQGYKYADTVIDEETGKALEYQELLKDPWYKDTWSRDGSNEYGRLFQGVGKNNNGTQHVKGTNTCHWIPRSRVPKGKKITYARMVVDICPKKADPNRVRITAGGDRLDYYGEKSTKTASIKTVKILINSVLSTTKSKVYVNCYIKFLHSK